MYIHTHIYIYDYIGDQENLRLGARLERYKHKRERYRGGGEASARKGTPKSATAGRG